MKNIWDVISNKFIRITWFILFVLLINAVAFGCSLMVLNRADWGFVVAGAVGVILTFTFDVWVVRFVKRWIEKQYKLLTVKEG